MAPAANAAAGFQGFSDATGDSTLQEHVAEQATAKAGDASAAEDPHKI